MIADSQKVEALVIKVLDLAGRIYPRSRKHERYKTAEAFYANELLEHDTPLLEHEASEIQPDEETQEELLAEQICQSLDGESESQPELEALEHKSDREVIVECLELARQNKEAVEEEHIRLMSCNGVSTAAMLYKPKTEHKWYVPGIARVGGTSSFNAPPKMGKTTLLFHAIGAQTRGEAFLNEETYPGDVLYISEQTEEILIDQLEVITSLYGNEHVTIVPTERNGYPKKIIKDNGEVAFHFTRPSNWEAQLEFWSSLILKHHPKVLIIDTFVPFCHFKGGEMADPGVVTLRIGELKQMVFQIDHEIAILLINHTRKLNGRKGDSIDFDDMLYGPMRGCMDFNTMLKPVKDDSPQRVLDYEGRRPGKAAKPEVTIELTDSGYVVLPDLKEVARKSDQPVRELALELGVSKSTAARWKKG